MLNRRAFPILSLVAVLALSGNASVAADSTPDLLSLIPPDSSAVVAVDWGEIRNSELFKDCEERFLRGKIGMGLREFAAATGLDPSRDIDRVVLAIRTTSSDPERPGAVAILTGRFDEARLVQAVEKQGATIERKTDSGATLYRLMDGRSPRPGPTVAFASPTLTLVGDSVSVLGALQMASRPAGGHPAESELRSAYGRARNQGQAWGAVRLESMLQAGPWRSGTKVPAALAALSAMRWVSFELRFGRELQLTLRGAAATPDEAHLVRQAVDGLIAVGRLGAKEDADLLAALAETVVERDQEVVVLETTLSPELLDRLQHRHATRAADHATRER